MKQIRIQNVLLLFALALAVVSCKKKGCEAEPGSTVAPPSERTLVTTYLGVQGINATEVGNSGLFYVIDNPGNDRKPGQCNTIVVKYKGQLTNGTIFDQVQTANGVSFELRFLIEGWRRGIPLIGEGGKIRLFIPPSMGYGSQAQIDASTGFERIPANSVLIFELEMLRIF
ncbi:MAG TPA: FKBP-type peptidyl-prolyl cis-trans isomerase [Lacibacter sp.]|nr:FKBP-type peptidyl-prolyl cis-trans isomerase [Lacibacter sp.]HMO89166.1 FKBP-type peptidyl-prolyl cis-trans isomerase [Lacibacter sp.]HMP86543.1 FKBP-type peptidyl-prolyl cis-trans isomerase [Lacibacter sp.]